MKRTKIYIVLVLICTIFLINGCSKKEKTADNCATLSTAASDALTAYSANPNSTTCEAFVQAINNYYQGCDLIPASVKQSYDVWLQQVDCSGSGK